MLAYDRCATAMLQTTIIGGLGLAVFATSTFTPTQQFGYLMISMLGAALLGDLLLLPAILVSPLGRPFGGKAPAKYLPDGEVSSDFDRSEDDTDEEDIQSAVLPIESASQPLRQSSDSSLMQQSSYSSSDIRREILDGPHAELHAKLRRLRRERPQDTGT